MAAAHSVVATETDVIEKKKDEETGIKTVNSFEIIKPLGKGAFGKVKLCKDTRDDKLYALKIMDKNVLKKKRQGMSNMLQSVQKEIAIMKKLNHKNVVIMYEVLDCPTNPKLYIRLEYVEGGQCMPSGNNVPPLDHDTARRYFKDLMCGLEYLHHNNILHRDIKPENLLVATEGLLKIADFGVSQVLESDDDMISKSAGTPAFTAPECCRPGAFHGKLADLWACGCTLYFFVHGRVPFMNPNVCDLYEDIQNKEIEYDETLPASLLDLLKKMLNKDPDERIKVTFAVINSHPWVTEGQGESSAPPTVLEKVSVSQEELDGAITHTKQILMLVKIHSVMTKRLANVRQKIEQRNSVNQMVAGLELKEDPKTPDTAGMGPDTSVSPSSAGMLPSGYEVAEDSGSDEETPTSGESAGAEGGRKKKGGKCAQQ